MGQVLTAHTDGACKGNPGPGGWAVVFSIQGEITSEHSGHEPHTTNNRMELAGIREAIARCPEGAAREIATDSQNAIGWLSGGFKRKKPAIVAMCRAIDVLIRKQRLGGGTLTFRHVRGHHGNRLNERADKLATDAANDIVVSATQLGEPQVPTESGG